MSNKFRIFRQENYLEIRPLNSSDVFTGHVKNILVSRDTTGENKFRFTGIKNWNPSKFLDLSQILDVNGDSYTLSSWIDFYTLNTGNFNVDENPNQQEVSDNGGYNNGSIQRKGSFDNYTGGNGGISDVCSIGFEKNWQGGKQRVIQEGNPNRALPLINDSAQTYIGQPFYNLPNLNTADLLNDNVVIVLDGDMAEQFNTTFTDNGSYKLYMYDEGNKLLGVGRFDGSFFADPVTPLFIYDIKNIKERATQNQIVTIIGYEFGQDSLITKQEAELIINNTKTKGRNYIIVKGTGTPRENAFELVNAYNQAVQFEPNSNNIFTIVVSPGYYNFNDAYEAPLDMQYDFIDLTSLTGNRDVIIQGGINFSAGRSNVSNMTIIDGLFTIEANGSECVIKNCEALEEGSFSPRNPYTNSGGEFTGTFIDCKAGGYSYGVFQNVNATFENCSGTNFSFGSSDDSTVRTNCIGTFKNCVAESNSFGYNGNTDGVFSNCNSGANSFCFSESERNQCSGVFNNCTSTDSRSFGYNSNVTASFSNCKSLESSFGGGGASVIDSTAIFNNCIAGDSSFGASSGFTAKAYHCVGGIYSFGGDSTLTGQLYYCKLTSGDYATVSGAGKTIYCIDGDDVPNNQL